MNIELVYVLVCTFQGDKFIAKQLDSIFSQTYPNIEVHVFDDYSNDQTLKVLKDYCLKHSNLFIHENENNIGFVRNFEKAIQTIKGKYIALSDQDDIWEMKKLEISMNSMKFLEKKYPNTPVLVHSDLSFIDEADNKLEFSFFKKKGIRLSSNRSLNKILGHCGVMGNTILMNRPLVEKVTPFPPRLKYHDYWISIINELFGVRDTIYQPLVKYRLHQQNTSNNNKSLLEGQSAIFFERNYCLPFKEDNREIVMRYILENYHLDKNDKSMIEEFENYLLLNGSRLGHFAFLLRNGFLKSGLFYRLSVLYRIVLTNRYTS